MYRLSLTLVNGFHFLIEETLEYPYMKYILFGLPDVLGLPLLDMLKFSFCHVPFSVKLSNVCIVLCAKEDVL